MSFEGIALLHRAAGGWHTVGEVALDVPDLAVALAALRDKALQLAPGGISCKLIIPNDQIRYMTLETGAAEGEARRARVRAALEGATPYAVAELAFDISVEGPLTHVAAVARETLAEAEAFAVEHRFNPVSFVAVPGDQPFLGEPFFGVAENAGAARVEPDGIAVVVTGVAQMPAPAPAAEPAAGPETAAEPAPEPQPGAAAQNRTDPKPAPAPVVAPVPTPDAPEHTGPETDAETDAETEAPARAAAVGFTSRRGKDGAPPTLAGASRGAPLPEAKAKPAPAAARDTAPAKAASGSKPVAIPIAAPPPAARTQPPETADRISPAAIPAAAARLQGAIGGLLSLRQRGRTGTAAPDAPTPAPPARAIAREEVERMTVFGARKAQRVGGKPRYLGLILTAVLLVFLAAVAAWAALFLDGGVAGLFRAAPAETRLAAAPDAEAPEIALAPAEPRTETPPQAPAAVAATDPETAPGDEPQAPELTDTDSAVLEALSPDKPVAGEDSAAMDPSLDPELEAEPEPDLGSADDETFYAATGIWPAAPTEPETPAIIGLNDLYVASIDRTDMSQDAVALPPAAGFDTDAGPNAVASPAAAGLAFALDDRGLVAATPDGALSPDGVAVYQGRPPVVPPALPARLTTQAEAAAETDALRDHLAGLRPRPRPTDLIEQTERAQLGGRSRDELGRLRPRLRPQRLQEAVAAALAAAQTATQTAEEPPADDTTSATAQAVAVALVPKSRPRELSTTARSSDRASLGIPDNTGDNGGDAEPEPASVAPSIPSSASVARQATLENEINLRQLNLIGVYGTAANRRALIRLPSGRYKKVKVGDSVDGGKVVAIGDTELRYQKGGRNLTLKIPSS